MTPPNRLSFAVLVTVCALVLAACGGSEPRALDPGTSASPSVTASTGKGSKAPGAVDGSKPGTAPSAGSTTSGGSSGGGGTTGGGTSSPAPARGTYTYIQSGKTVRGSDYPSRGTLAVAAAKSSANGVQQEQTRKKLEEGDGETTVYEFRTDEVVVLRRTQGGNLCTLNPPLKVLMLPIRVGQSWTSHSECKVNESVTVTIDFSASILREETKRIGSTDVETFVMSSTLITKFGVYASSTEKATSWLSPKYKLVVRSEETSELSTGASGTFREQLVSLEPKE